MKLHEIDYMRNNLQTYRHLISFTIGLNVYEIHIEKNEDSLHFFDRIRKIIFAI